MPTPRRRARRWLRSGLPALVCVGLLAAGLVCWAAWAETDTQKIARLVRSELPAGTHRKQVEAWMAETYGAAPVFHEDVTGNRIRGRTIPQRAGVPADEL